MIRHEDLLVCFSLSLLGYATGGLIGAVVLPGLTIGVGLTALLMFKTRAGEYNND